MKLRLMMLSAALVAGCGEPDQPPTTTTASQTATQPPANDAVTRVPREERLHYLELPELEGFAEHGRRIDLLGVFEAPDSAGGPTGVVVMTLLQNVAVLDVRGKELGLSLTIDEVELIEAATMGGQFIPLLRGPEDVEVSTIAKTTLGDAMLDLQVLQEKRQIRAKQEVAGSSRIPARERAMSIAHGLPEGVLRSGQRLDIFGRFEASNTVTTLLQNVRVLSVRGDEAFVAVSVDEAMMLAVCRDEGTLSFALRSPGDIEISTITTKTLADVLSDLEVLQEKRQIRTRRKPAKAVYPMDTIEIIAGDGGGGGGMAYVAPIATEKYVSHGVNDFTDTSADRLSTFAADVDTGSYTIARRKILEGSVVPPASVRVEEWVNYFDYGYPSPTGGDAFAVSIEAAPSPFQIEDRYRLVRIGVQGKTIPPQARKPVHLTFLVDVSGSMGTPDKLGLAQASLRRLVGSLRPQDTVAITTYAGSTQTLLEPTTVSHEARILAAIDRLSSGGSTAMDDGLQKAYALAQRSFVKGHENRVIVLSDGDANVGRTSVDDMLKTIAAGAERGVTLSTIGFGMGNYNDAAMERLANKGNGNYFYIDSEAEAEKVFGEQLDGTIQTIARDVKLQVEFDPSAVVRYRLVGYENRDVADKDFRNDAVDAGEIGAGHSVTALYEIELAASYAPTIATVRVRHKPPQGSDEAAETSWTLTRAEMAAKLAQSSDGFRFAAAVAAFAEITRESKYAEQLNYDWVLEVARGAAGSDQERAEFIRLVETAALAL